MKTITIQIDEKDGALLHRRWEASDVDPHRIKGFWAEDLNSLVIEVPVQLRDLLVDLQNRLVDARTTVLEQERQQVAGTGLYYIRSRKHDQNNPKGNELALWWCPNSQGYTNDLRNAGKYSEAEARDICGLKNSTRKGQDWEANNIMYPTALIDALGTLTVNKYSAEAALRVAEAGEKEPA